jgi:Ca-activated chloride channel homolog
MSSHHHRAAAFERESKSSISQKYPRSKSFGFASKIACWCFFLFQFVAATWGQGFIIHEHDPRFRMPRPWHPENRSYRVKELAVDANIKDQIASTSVTQIFENTGSVPIEATFVFPLPYDGAVDKMTFLVDGREIEAKLLPANQARSIYEGYVRRNQDPALLEWMGHGMFKSSVFPISVGQTRTVTLRYSQLLRKDQRMTDYVFPMTAAKYTSQPLEKLSIRVAIEAADEIKSIYSPSHEIQLNRDDSRHAVVRHTAEKTIPANDFRLVFDVAAGKVSANVLSYWPEGDDQGYFLLLASPEFKNSSEIPLRKTVIFVVDQSGSMSGQKIEQAREAAKFVLQNLRPDDLFNIIRYENEVVNLAPELQRFNESSRESAVGFINSINSGGGTNIDGALKAAMGMIPSGDDPSYVVFLTDGLPTVGETNELKIAKNCLEANKFGARLISFGVGFDVNSRLLDRLARENNGQSEYVTPNENIETVVGNLYKKLSAPVLAKLNLQFNFSSAIATDGDVTNRIYPQKLTDLFAGSQLVVVGRYKKAGPAKIKLSGQVSKKEEAFEFDVNFAERGQHNSNQFVRQLWAVRRIGEIIDLMDMNGRNEELIKELVELSIRHGIVTPYTSYLADENQKPNQLSDFRSNAALADKSVAELEENAFGAQGFGLRVRKQEMKNAELAAALPATRAGLDKPTAGIGGGGNSDIGGEGGPSGLRGIRKVGNATIYQRGNLLIADNAAAIDIEKDQSVIKLKKFSDEYFKLIAQNTAEENLIIAQQDKEEMLIVLRGKTYLIQQP